MNKKESKLAKQMVENFNSKPATMYVTDKGMGLKVKLHKCVKNDKGVYITLNDDAVDAIDCIFSYYTSKDIFYVHYTIVSLERCFDIHTSLEAAETFLDMFKSVEKYNI